MVVFVIGFAKKEDRMNRTKWMIGLVVVMFLFGTIACGGGKYGDAKQAISKSNKALEGFLAKMDKADNAKTVAATAAFTIHRLKRSSGLPGCKVNTTVPIINISTAR